MAPAHVEVTLEVTPWLLPDFRTDARSRPENQEQVPFCRGKIEPDCRFQYLIPTDGVRLGLPGVNHETGGSLYI